jgi:hypothetical protein
MKEDRDKGRARINADKAQDAVKFAKKVCDNMRKAIRLARSRPKGETLNGIAGCLTELGVKTRAGASTWHPQQVSRIIYKAESQWVEWAQWQRGQLLDEVESLNPVDADKSRARIAEWFDKQEEQAKALGIKLRLDDVARERQLFLPSIDD